MAGPTISVNIGASTAELDRGLQTASQNIRSFASNSARALGKVAKSAGVAAIAAGAGLLALANSQAGVIDSNTKLARSLGLTHNEFIAMAQVAGEAGVATTQLSQILGIMQRNIIELGEGTKAQADAFGRLGLSMVDLEGQSPAAQFAIIADRLNRIEDPATRTATAMDVLGRSGRAAINMLDGYADKVRDAAEFQSKFGLAVSQLDAENIEAANDAFGRVFEALKGVGRIIAAAVAPAVKDLADKFLATGVDAEKMRETAVAAFDGIVRAVKFVADNLERLIYWAGAAAAAFGVALATGLGVAAASAGSLAAALLVVRGALIRSGIGLAVVAVGELAFQFSKITGPVDTFRNATDSAVRSMGDEITQSNLLKTALGQGSVMSVAVAKAKLDEARARHANVKAMIAEQRAQVVSSKEFVDLSEQIRRSQEAELAVSFIGEKVAARKSAAFEERQQATVALLEKQRDLLETDVALSDQMKVTAENIATVTAALAAQKEGMVTTGDGVAPIVPGQGEGEGGGATTPITSLGALGTPEMVTEEMAIRLEALREGLMTEEETIAEWYARGQEALAFDLAKKGEMNAESLQDRLRLEAEHASRVQALEERKNQLVQRSQDAAYASVRTGLLALFGESKAVRVAMAIADTFAGANRALAEHPAPFSYAIAAGIVATGLANVKSIMSARPGGGGASASGGAAAGAAAAAKEPDRTQTFSFNIQNDSMGFGESFARQMVEQLNNAQRNGGTIRGVIA